ncbi:hypothetical protein TPHA_0K01410 [Tetrapisispora phaffii CBS 4417]|uniref:Uncharacterized protein n=1 Tax=Tetrapisispora phaffii (strain ATCC 24235 / CBS 4417 / NBRC 1672 / NRRL Y-8282 / UCD 70-5) TaxID=1071381 RepID=G8BZE6_TETPH|nr:hypothetical protein TPHA_0K01410 [Tetrapisispora phaffii CBS 4417]CCE65274.1 hypothetical protein TPHA_0K01410 [Tetrapisispora phaffii CBS 4417]
MTVLIQTSSAAMSSNWDNRSYDNNSDNSSSNNYSKLELSQYIDNLTNNRCGSNLEAIQSRSAFNNNIVLTNSSDASSVTNSWSARFKNMFEKNINVDDSYDSFDSSLYTDKSSITKPSPWFTRLFDKRSGKEQSQNSSHQTESFHATVLPESICNRKYEETPKSKIVEVEYTRYSQGKVEKTASTVNGSLRNTRSKNWFKTVFKGKSEASEVSEYPGLVQPEPEVLENTYSDDSIYESEKLEYLPIKIDIVDVGSLSVGDCLTPINDGNHNIPSPPWDYRHEYKKLDDDYRKNSGENYDYNNEHVETSTVYSSYYSSNNVQELEAELSGRQASIDTCLFQEQPILTTVSETHSYPVVSKHISGFCDDSVYESRVKNDSSERKAGSHRDYTNCINPYTPILRARIREEKIALLNNKSKINDNAFTEPEHMRIFQKDTYDEEYCEPKGAFSRHSSGSDILESEQTKKQTTTLVDVQEKQVLDPVQPVNSENLNNKKSKNKNREVENRATTNYCCPKCCYCDESEVDMSYYYRNIEPITIHERFIQIIKRTKYNFRKFIKRNNKKEWILYQLQKTTDEVLDNGLLVCELIGDMLTDVIEKVEPFPKLLQCAVGHVCMKLAH